MNPWQAHAAQRLQEQSARRLVAPTRMEWTQHPGHGPDARLFGDALQRYRVLELGCGPGHNLAHLVVHHGCVGVGTDAALLQIRRARAHYGHLPGLELYAADALTYLNSSSCRFDIVYSVFGAVGLTPPNPLLSAVASRLVPGGRLAFSVPHPYRSGRESDHGPQPRRTLLRLPNGTTAPLPRWELPPSSWRAQLKSAGFTNVTAEEHHNPQGPAMPMTLLITARRL